MRIGELRSALLDYPDDAEVRLATMYPRLPGRKAFEAAAMLNSDDAVKARNDPEVRVVWLVPDDDEFTEPFAIKAWPTPV